MKLTAFLFCLCLCSAVHAQDNTLPREVEKGFRKQHPGIIIDDWYFEDRLYHIEFKKEAHTFTSIIDEHGNWIETAITLADRELPAVLLKNVRKQYPSAVFSVSEKVESKNKPAFFRLTLYVDGKSLLLTADLEGENIATSEPE